MNKRKYKKIVLNVITIMILLVVLYLVFRKDFQAIQICIRNISVYSLLLLIGMGIVYQLLDAAVCFALIHPRLPSFQYKQAVDVIYLGVFGKVATSAAGTIPLQSYYLYRQGMKVGNGIGSMILQYVFHKTVIFLYAGFMVLLYGSWLKAAIPEITKYIYPGLAVSALIIVFLVLLCTWTPIQQLLLWLIGKLPDTDKWNGRKDAWTGNLEILYAESKEMLRNRACCRNAMLLNFLKLFWLFIIPYLCLKALGVSGMNFGNTQTVASMMLLLMGVLPNVSGAGSAEIAFLLLFTPLVGRVSAFSALILYRVATYFFPFLLSIGVSAGSANVTSYMAGQKKRNFLFYTEYPFRKEYMSIRNFLFKRSYIDMDYLYGTLSNSTGENPLDYEALKKNDAELLVVATNAQTGSVVYFNKDDLKQDDYGILKASSSIPFVCKPCEINGIPYYDGALGDPVPVEKAFQCGCDKVVVILSKPRDFIRSPKKDITLADRIRKKYPLAAEQLEKRAEHYNQGVQLAKEYEAQGRVLIVAPDHTCGVDTLTKDKKALKQFYEKGYRDARAISWFLG